MLRPMQDLMGIISPGKRNALWLHTCDRSCATDEMGDEK
jgi:hypothetical protein